MQALSTRAYLHRGHHGPADLGMRRVLALTGVHSMRELLRADLDAATVNWLGSSFATVHGSGDVGTKVVLVVVADGFAATDQGDFDDVVDRLVVRGLFGLDFFAAHADQFIVFRLGLVSGESGVGTITLGKNADGTLATDAAGNHVVTATNAKDTALGVLFSGEQGDCWLRDGPDTTRWLGAALDTWVPDYDLAFVLLNNAGFGGCGGNHRLTLPTGVGADTIAHELGHALGGLGDEYSAQAGTYSGDEPGVPNQTKATTLDGLKWKGFVAAGTPIPSGSGADVGWTAGPKPATWDDNQSVGLFEGAGDKFDRGIYRPVISCRMRSNNPPYCPVCDAAMSNHVNALITPAPAPGAAPGDASYVRLTVHAEGESLRVVDARTVAGALATGEVAPGLSQRTMVGDTVVAASGIGDPDVQRSFENLAPGESPTGHHSYRLDSFDFFVRVPSERIAGVDPGELSIELLRVPHADVAPDPTNVATPDLDRAERVAVMPRLERDALAPSVQRVLFDDG